MNYVDPSFLREEPPLEQLTENIRKGRSITWYRSVLSPADMKKLHRKSDFKGAVQTVGYLATILLSGALAFYSFSAWPWYVTASLVFLHGVFSSFHINAVHELGHGTVFKTKRLNGFFCPIVSFLGWINHEAFQSSHTRHHRYTLHPPDDLEVALPIKLVIWHLLRDGLVNPKALLAALRYHWRIARGDFRGPWEISLYPASTPEKRRPAIRMSRNILLGHALILLVSILTGWWMLFVVLSLSPFIGNALFLLCNNTQHIGLQDNVADFRLCSRTFILNPVVRFLYWQMNYHIEHHMYAAVPCYNLGRLHKLIAHDLPPTPRGLLAVWRDIYTILKIQEANPGYQHVAVLPTASIGMAPSPSAKT